MTHAKAKLDSPILFFYLKLGNPHGAHSPMEDVRDCQSLTDDPCESKIRFLLFLTQGGKSSWSLLAWGGRKGLSDSHTWVRGWEKPNSSAALFRFQYLCSSNKKENS